ncbi:hypothetical protein H2248_005671 [Termitomyces sp. 'cryptogamus']|nr:hypothetical protein H2248_005671 [Termitomyces sp. 'cryptogamus']
MTLPLRIHQVYHDCLKFVLSPITSISNLAEELPLCLHIAPTNPKSPGLSPHQNTAHASRAESAPPMLTLPLTDDELDVDMPSHIPRSTTDAPAFIISSSAIILYT